MIPTPPKRHHTPTNNTDTNHLLHELILMGHEHTKGIYRCMVCGNNQKQQNHVVSAKVGETEGYNYCQKCGQFYFYPHVQLIILQTVQKAGPDYVGYKRLVDTCCRRLPTIVQPAFMYEAHRWATSRYAWSLAGPENAREMLGVTFRHKPRCSRILSMGAGTGYIEHVFLHAARDVGKPVDVRAYDLMPQKRVGAIDFDVKVQMGGVDSLQAFGDLSEDVLLLCWPPFGSKVGEESRMAYDTVLQFEKQGGNFLVYIGDVNATGMDKASKKGPIAIRTFPSGDWRFHDHLASHWESLPETLELTKLDVWVPQKMGLIYAGNDSAGLYRKRDVPLKVCVF